MTSLQADMLEYQKQLERGAIQKAYRGLMDFMMHLRIHFRKTHPDYSVSGGLYFGYMDMTYFAIVPKSLGERGLKIAIVFLHEAFRFEVWLSGKNKQVLTNYWNLLKDHDWEPDRVASPGKWMDSVLEHTVVENPDFGDLAALTEQIETGTLSFIAKVESFLSKQEIPPSYRS